MKWVEDKYCQTRCTHIVYRHTFETYTVYIQLTQRQTQLGDRQKQTMTDRNRQWQWQTETDNTGQEYAKTDTNIQILDTCKGQKYAATYM